VKTIDIRQSPQNTFVVSVNPPMGIDVPMARDEPR